MKQLIYVTHEDPNIIKEIRRAGFDGYIRTEDSSQYKLVIFGSASYPYWDEPDAAIPGHAENFKVKLVELGDDRHKMIPAYKGPKDAIERGVWFPELDRIGHFIYPFKESGWFGRRLWERYITFPLQVWRFKKKLPKGKPVLGIIQAFALTKWIMPTERQIRWQKWVWKWLFGKSLWAIAYFIWDVPRNPDFKDTVSKHPEIWPSRR